MAFLDYCISVTYAKVFEQIKILIESGADVHTIFSHNARTINSRFGKGSDFAAKAEVLTGNKPILSIDAAEPIGPKGWLDILTILPCTGNTLAKLANGITDSSVLMAAKAHLRNEKPLVLSVSTNDALSMNLKNIGLLMNTKNIYFVPFGQDDPSKKPHSMIAHLEMVVPALESALDGKQVQPVVISPF
jgi:dipicolinate synthase subunit B